MTAQEWTTPGSEPARKILILGGGFAGVYTAYALQRALGDIPAEIAIVNRENFFVFYPLLPEIISGAVETEAVLNPIRHVVPEATLYVGEVRKIDLARQEVEISHGLYRHRQTPRTLSYDHLVLALGGVPNTNPIPGLAEYAFDVQRLSRAFALRNHLIDTLEQADIETNPIDKRRLLTFVTVGGGANGVEVAAQIRDLMQGAIRFYRHLDPDEVRVILIHGGKHLIPDLPTKLGVYAGKLLKERGIEVRYETRVTAVEPGLVRLNTGEVIEAETVVGSVGVQPNPLVRDLPVPRDERGRVRVSGTLQVAGYPNVWALGDNALVLDPSTGEPYPQTAQHAVREARIVAENIVCGFQQKPLKEIHYRTMGQLVALGHQSAVANIRGLTFSGLPAWWLWRTYYLSQIPRWDKRLRVASDWTLDLLFPPALVQLKVGQPAPTARPEHAAGEPAPSHDS